MTPDDVRQAVAEGIRDALSDPATSELFWTTAFAAMQRKATQETGRLVLSGLKRGLVNGAVFMLLGLIVYQIGGWAALIKLAKVLSP